MREVSRNHVIQKLQSTNPWWGDESDAAIPFSDLRERKYFFLFRRLAFLRTPVRALLLMGPRRVGKTVLVFHLIRWLIRSGSKRRHVFYIDVQQPLYDKLALEELVRCAAEASGSSTDDELTVCFDEIQYLRNWEFHLKALVDSFPRIKFIATGSAASALRLKSRESGAGRFTDFLLPPLTFYEYLDLIEQSSLIRVTRRGGKSRVSTQDIEAVNKHFVDYLNYGGYPEAVFSKAIRADPGRYIRSDIIEKVLLKDLPSLYGIQDIQELNSLFTSLAYNTANEVSLGQLSQKSGVAKNTLKRYIEYLESTFLIRVVHRVDQSAKRFQRANFFKVYLTNPSIRSAIFSPVSADSDDMGDLVETAVFSQWFHSMSAELHYARWKDGEVDIVSLDRLMRPAWAVEVKWSDKYEANPRELRSLLAFRAEHPKCLLRVTTRTRQSSKTVDMAHISFLPTSLYCYVLGYNIIQGKAAFSISAAPPTAAVEREDPRDRPSFSLEDLPPPAE